MKWPHPVSSTQCKFDIYFLKDWRASLQTGDLILLFKSIILPVLEYARAVWYSGLTQDQSSILKSLQKRAMWIIYVAMVYKDAILLNWCHSWSGDVRTSLSKCKTAKDILHHHLLPPITKIRNLYPIAAFAHCTAHRLNVVINDLNSVEQVRKLRNPIGTIKVVIKFCRESTKCRWLVPNVPSFCDTWQSAKYKGIRISLRILRKFSSN